MNSVSPKAEKPAFIRKQFEFAAHIRHPGINPAPQDIEPRRMNIYTELFYNNIENFVSTAFPVLREITADDDWHAMVRDFMYRHRCQTPYFLEIPEEFLDYLQNERKEMDDPPWLVELAHYEWVELALSVFDEDTDDQAFNPDGHLLESVPRLSPLAWPLAYRYAVHRIGPDQLPEKEEPTQFVVYRDDNDEIHFLEINPVTYRLLELLNQDNTLNGRQLLLRIAEEIGHPDPDAVVDAGHEIMQDLRERGILDIAR